MPQGVEHEPFITDASASAQVRIPLMPQGVEHASLTPSLSTSAM